MKNNPHKDMELHSIWLKRGEMNEIFDALEGNLKEALFNLMFKIIKRGDLK